MQLSLIQHSMARQLLRQHDGLTVRPGQGAEVVLVCDLRRRSRGQRGDGGTGQGTAWWVAGRSIQLRRNGSEVGFWRVVGEVKEEHETEPDRRGVGARSPAAGKGAGRT